MSSPSIEVRSISTRSEFDEHGALMQDVWGTSTPLVNVELLTALAHSGGYVAAAFTDDRMVGASVGFLADHHGEPALHSHVTGVVASMRHAGGPRREIGIRTVFNILGPLTNPAGAKRQLLGVYDARLAPLMAEVAGRLGAERTLVVNGHPGMDEVSASGPTTIAEFDAASGGVRTYTVTPEEVGIARSTLADIAGGDAAANAALVRGVLEGEHGPRRDVVLLNAAAALMAAGRVADLASGVVAARESIDSGRALDALERLVTTSRRLAEAAAEGVASPGAASGAAS